VYGFFRQGQAVDHGLFQAVFPRGLQVQHIGRYQALQIALDGIGHGVQGPILLVGIGTGYGAAGLAGSLANDIHIMLNVHGLVLKYMWCP